MTVSLQGLTSGHVYYCKAAASSNNTASCAGPVVGGVKGYITFVASLPSTTFPTACKCIHEHLYMTELYQAQSMEVILATHITLLINEVCQLKSKNNLLVLEQTLCIQV